MRRRIFALSAGCGFFAGAVLAVALMWPYGSAVRSHGASAEQPAPAPPALDELWIDGGIDDAGEGVIRGRGAERPGPGLDASLERELADRGLMIPVEGVTADQLIQSFLHRRNSREHQAIDILAPRNTPVLAVEAGTIARLFYSEAGGITIYQFDPTGRFSYYYAHLEQYADGLVEGQQVEKGDTIGYVGTSGNAPEDTPHLHFAIFHLTSPGRWWEGTALDPYEVLR